MVFHVVLLSFTLSVNNSRRMFDAVAENKSRKTAVIWRSFYAIKYFLAVFFASIAQLLLGIIFPSDRYNSIFTFQASRQPDRLFLVNILYGLIFMSVKFFFREDTGISKWLHNSL